MTRPPTVDAAAVAAALVTARTTGQSLTGYPGALPPDMATAYRIQDLAMDRWSDTLVGWKIGYVAPEWRAPGEPGRLVGPIWDAACHQREQDGTATQVSVFTPGFAAVEAELVVRLRVDLPTHDGADWTGPEAAGLDQELLFGIEVASSPIPDINSLGPTVVASDFGNNNGLVLGPTIGGVSDPSSLQLACYIDEQLVGRATGANLPGGLHHGLATAFNVLAGRGRRVRAGMVFATGAITGIHPIGPGQHCRVELVGVSAVNLRTVATTPGTLG